MENIKNGDDVKVTLHGDSNIFNGIVINAKKKWVSLTDYYSKEFIADENNIVEIKLTK